MNAPVRKLSNNSSTTLNEPDYRTKSAGHYSSTFKNIHNLQQTRKFCDIIIRVEQKEYFAHKVVLASVSQYFSDILDGDERRTIDIEFKDIPPLIFELILEYAYTGNIAVTSDNIKNLIVTSKTLGMDTLETACSEALINLLSPFNACKMKAIAGEECSDEVYNKCREYTLQHFMEIAESEAFLQLPLEEVKEFVTDDNIVISSEEEIYSAVLKWLKHDLSSRKQYLLEMMTNIRFPLMNHSFFVKSVLTESLLADDFECTKLLLDTTKYHAGVQRETLSSKTIPRKHFKNFSSCLFAIGGQPSGGPEISECEVFNPKTNTWHPISSMHSKRRSHAVIGFRRQLYAFGGFNHHEKALSSVEYYDTMKNAWAWTVPMPSERYGHAICSLNDSIFICGGQTGTQRSLSTVEQFDPLIAVYRKCPPMNTNRAWFKMAATDDCIYAIGGRNPKILDSMERFDPREGIWFPLPPMNRRRSHHAVTVFDGYIYCTGLLSGEFVESESQSGECFNIRRMSWEPIPNMVSNRWGHELVTLDGSIYAVGGAFDRSVEKYDPEVRHWVTLSSTLEERWYLGAVATESFNNKYFSN